MDSASFVSFKKIYPYCGESAIKIKGRCMSIKIEQADNDEGGYIAIIPELGCIGDGGTIEEAINDVKEVAKNLLEIAKEDGILKD